MLPLVKLGILGIKILSKQIVKYAKDTMTKSPTFTTMAIKFGRFYHKYEFRWKTGRRSKSLEDIDDARAVQVAAEIMGEALLFAILSGLLFWELQSKPKSESVSEEINLQLQSLREEIKQLHNQVEELKKKQEQV